MENVILNLAGQTKGIDNLLATFAKQGDTKFHEVATILAEKTQQVANEVAEIQENSARGNEIVYDDFYVDYLQTLIY